MEKGYKIARKFGKGIVDGSGKQVAWVDDYVMAKAVCMFLNRGINGLYPSYAKIGEDYYELDGNEYYCARSGIRLDFTVVGDKLYSVSGVGVYDRLLVEGCDSCDWLDSNRGFV